MRLTAGVAREGNWYVATCSEVEAASQDRMVEEALTNLREALELYFDDTSPLEPLQSPIVAPRSVLVVHMSCPSPSTGPRHSDYRLGRFCYQQECGGGQRRRASL